MAPRSQNATNAELAVLSLLAEQPMHGYQIEQIIKARGMREWTDIGFSSIYYILEKLRLRGDVHGRLEPAEVRGPARQVFSLTPQGRQVFRKAALNALSRPSRTFSNFQLGLAALPFFSKTEALENLRKYLTLLHEKKAALQNKHDALEPTPPWQAATLFDLDLTQLQCELEWLEKFILNLETLPDQNPPGEARLPGKRLQ